SLSSQSGGEGAIRQAIVEDDLVECIVAMPAQLFYTTQIPASLWFLNRKKKQKDKTLFIDARSMGTMVNRRLRELTDADIAKISGTVDTFCEGKLKVEKGFCTAVSTKEIARQDYILTPWRYVGIAEEAAGDEPFPEKMTRLTTELRGLFSESHKLEREIKKRLGAIGWEV
ncbi:MAG: SAM-dependent methyltransferase, partial [Holosporaceae bacterium]|nr:SAM-dependent methyltransferase [Holosporaceae bacterium]